ncbi:uncharacterized protein LOC135090751 isoform X1 [Scylla paramamosain]|uniref:uncharacterized protein LOC135090751 isoform X1 n=2 Tax=Scylla paramamosain TaxID=85552 RepID=UPI003083D352
MRAWRKDPLEVCGSKHTNATLEFHECVCKFDYRRHKNYQQTLKYKHCLLADEMRRIDNFELYVIIAVVVGVVLIFSVAAFCSCKWYLHTNSNPCGCCPCHSCKKKKRKKKEETTGVEADGTSSHGFENGNQAWTPIRLVPSKEGATYSQEPQPDTESLDRKKKGLCMKFCLSDPVQDCCEFFDCDLMWRKKSIYTIPVFGRRKPPPMQRRPTRPAPPPPKPPVPPIVKHPEPLHIGFEELQCEPIPEAPPSPEPVRVDQPRAMYVDPFAFLQKPFLRSKEKIPEEEPEALYNKMKGLVFGKKKSGSVASLNHVGVSKNPDTVSNTSSKKSKYSRTGSLASLHNFSDEQLDSSYQAKRSMSLASLHMVEEENTQQLMPKGPGSRLNVARSRGSLHNISEDDIPPSMRTDEYIDLEEMNKRIEAKMLAAQGNTAQYAPTPPQKPTVNIESKPAPPLATSGLSMGTPDFIPASAFTKPTGPQHYPQYSPTSSQGEGMMSKYYPPVPATPEKPAVPARLAVGTPVSGTGTLGRTKPTVPPRPGSGSSSPKPRAPQPPSTLSRSGHVVKPTAPPPPPPVTAPIESSL